MDVAPDVDELDYAGGGLPKETNWWGAFVIGLAGTILVTGIAPVMVTTLGAASIPITIVITISGWLLCLFLAEQAEQPTADRDDDGDRDRGGAERGHHDRRDAGDQDGSGEADHEGAPPV